MAFPTTSVLDNFTGTDGTDLPVYSTNWARTDTNMGGNLEIQGNAATAIAAAAESDYWTVSNFGPDSEAFITFTTLPPSVTFNGISLRLVQEGGTGTVDGYQVVLRPSAGAANDVVRYFRIDNAVFTTLGADITQEFATGDALGLEMIGTTLKAYYKASGGSWGTIGTSRTDATYASAGKIGIYCDNTTVRMDSFGGGTVAAGWALLLNQSRNKLVYTI